MQDPEGLHKLGKLAGRWNADLGVQGGMLPIETVSSLLGVPAATLRSWERRYAFLSSGRSEGGHRRYTPEQVAVLRRVRDEIAAGRPASQAALLASAAISHSPEMLAETIVQAAHRLDGAGIAAVLDRAKPIHGLAVTIQRVVLPAMRDIGDQWAFGRCDVAHEHLATGAVRRWLNQESWRPQPSASSQPVILACGPGDSHTIGLEAFGVLLGARGHDCRLLGARTPTTALVAALDELGEAAVVVVSQLSWTRAGAVESLRASDRSGSEVYYAGAAFVTPRSRRGVPGTYLGEDLADAAECVTARGRPPPGHRRGDSARDAPAGVDTRLEVRRPSA
jgi:DNA-binding transcriptional MerR regulator/methylmalonyl-CoA mutase cobalamin-binding subunit